MEKYVSFGVKEEVIECDIDITYTDFLDKMKELFNLKENAFNINDLTEDNFNEMMTVKDNFIIERSEKDLARERLGNITDFNPDLNMQEAEDFLLLYGFKTDEYGDSPLLAAAYYGRLDLVKLILSKNFDNVNQTDKSNKSSLYWAAFKGYTDIVELLLEQNFDNAHKEDNSGNTPLYAATHNRHLDIVKLLLKKNFDNVHHKNHYSESPLDRSKFMHFTEITKILEEDIARREKENK